MRLWSLKPEDEQLWPTKFRIAWRAFANVVDAKSPWTYQHSIRVAEIAVGVAPDFNCPQAGTRSAAGRLAT